MAIIPWPGDAPRLDTPVALPPPRNGSAMDTDPATENSAQLSSSEAWELGMQSGPGAGLAQDLPWPASSGGQVTREKHRGTERALLEEQPNFPNPLPGSSVASCNLVSESLR